MNFLQLSRTFLNCDEFSRTFKNFLELTWTFMKLWKSWTFVNFHELSWTFMNFFFKKSWNHETLQLQGDCAALEHRCDASLVKSWNLSCSSFYDALSWVFSWTHSFNRRRRQGNYASLHKIMTAKNWETNLNVDTLLESKVASRWSVVNYESRMVRTFCNAWQRKGIWVAGSQKAVTAATVRVAKTGGVAAPKKAAVAR